MVFILIGFSARGPLPYRWGHVSPLCEKWIVRQLVSQSVSQSVRIFVDGARITQQAAHGCDV